MTEKNIDQVVPSEGLEIPVNDFKPNGSGSDVPANRPRKVYGGIWGQAEIATVGAAMLAVLAVILLYIFFVLPSNRQLDRDRTERDRLETELVSARSKYGNITSTENQVSKLAASVNDFETNNLAIPAIGKNTLYQRLNGLIAAYGLVNTSGPDYAPLETADQNNGPQTDEERGRAKYRSIFPGIYVTMTVEGSYQNLRRFIADIERGNDFVVISSVQLEPSDSEGNKEQPGTETKTNAQLPAYSAAPIINGQNGPSNPAAGPVQAQPQFQRPKGKTHGETVSLRLEMAAYFRRANFAPITEPAPQN